MTTSPALPSGAAVGAVELQRDRRRVAGGEDHLAPDRHGLLLAGLQQPLDRFLAVDGGRDPAGTPGGQRDRELIAGGGGGYGRRQR